jgi:hypothetical protein
MQVVTGPHVHVLLVHITIQMKMGLITKPYDLGYCWIVFQKHLKVTTEVNSPGFTASQTARNICILRTDSYTFSWIKLIMILSWVAEKDVLQIIWDPVSVPTPPRLLSSDTLNTAMFPMRLGNDAQLKLEYICRRPYMCVDLSNIWVPCVNLLCVSVGSVVLCVCALCFWNLCHIQCSFLTNFGFMEYMHVCV